MSYYVEIHYKDKTKHCWSVENHEIRDGFLKVWWVEDGEIIKETWVNKSKINEVKIEYKEDE